MEVVEMFDENLGTILYVEDHPDNRLLVRRVLMAEGYTVYEAPSATQAFGNRPNCGPDSQRDERGS
jgi:response regulator RpfG family c-di-GMP phosphodiesterase